MKNIFKSLIVLAAVSAAAVSCKETNEYEWAEEVGNAEVYFPLDLASSYNLKDYDGSLSVKVKRVKTEDQLTVPITIASDAIFTAPSSVTFTAGSSDAVIAISYDLNKIEDGKEYPISITLGDANTPYGLSSYEFSVSIPATWNVWRKGHVYEIFWGEDETETMYYQDLGNDVWYCYIENCFDTGGGASPQNYYFYWDKKTNYLQVPFQYMGYTSSYGKVYVSDAENVYKALYGGDEYFKEEGLESAAHYCYEVKGYNRPYYDGNGGFYLGDWYMFGPDAGDYFGAGYQYGGEQDYFIAEGFVRTVYYNDEKHIGASSALYDGVAASMFFSSDNGGTPEEFNASLRYDASYLESYVDEEGNLNADKIPDDLTTTYYLADWFGADSCLAFTAPVVEKLKDGSKISDVENDQATGISVFGNDIYVQVENGEFSFAADNKFPTLSIRLEVYSKNKDGEKVYDFGTLTETFTAQKYTTGNNSIQSAAKVFSLSPVGDSSRQSRGEVSLVE